VLVDPAAVDPPISDQLVQQGVEERDVRAVADREVHIGVLRRNRRPGIDDHELRRMLALEPVEDPHPEHGLGLGDVVADEKQRVAALHVDVRGGLAVGGEGLLERRAGGCGAQARVPIDVRRSKARPRHHHQRVVVLEEELTRVVEAEASGSALREQLLRPGDDRPIAVSQSVSRSSPSSRTRGRTRRSSALFACHP
jgi:hypothetical protein